VLKPLHSVLQLQRIRKVFDILVPVRMRNHQLVIITVGLASDFVIQPEMLAFEEPDHSSDVSV
jgi:hypothetical protein